MSHHSRIGLWRVVAGSLGLVASCNAFGGGGGTPCLPQGALPDQVVVELHSNASIDAVLAAVSRQFPGVTLALSIPSEGLYLLSAPDPICEADLVAALMAQTGVEEAEFNESGETVEGQTQSFFFASDKTAFDAQYLWERIRLPEAHDVALGDGVVVACIDTGLDLSHPHFAGISTLPGLDFVGDGAGLGDLGNGLDDDGDGVADEMSGHGTFVSGIVATIAPHATLLPIRAIDSDGHGSAFAVASALLAARDAGADVVNLSFGNVEDIGLLEPVIDSLLAEGILVVVSAGNGGNVGQGTFPSEMSGVCAVAATDASDVKAVWSNCGEFVTLCAPGIDVISTFPGGGYAGASGTSTSAAVLSGVAALVMSHAGTNGEATVATLAATAANIALANPKYPGALGAGRIDAAAALGLPLPSGDLNHDARVDATDLGLLIGSWSTALADLNADGTTDAADLGILIGGWTG
ncbi:MAG: S8 family serine peptidase [Phycisphaerae bacterium]|nr:S8 family serine peptidase [Phycisphaerae bacterium]